jgi:hypothetical protein
MDAWDAAFDSERAEPPPRTRNRTPAASERDYSSAEGARLQSRIIHCAH